MGETNSKYNNSILPNGQLYTSIDFEGIETLICYRTSPYSFSLASSSKECNAKDVRVFYNKTVSRQGAKQIITAVRDYALSNLEIWTIDQLKSVQGAKTLYIIYKFDTWIYLTFSKEALSEDQIIELEGSEYVWLTYDVSEVGLIELVNKFLDWL